TTSASCCIPTPEPSDIADGLRYKPARTGFEIKGEDDGRPENHSHGGTDGARFARRGRRPERPPMGCADATLDPELPDRHRPIRLGTTGDPRARHPEEMLRAGERRAGEAPAREGRPHRARGAGGDRRPPR